VWARLLHSHGSLGLGGVCVIAASTGLKRQSFLVALSPNVVLTLYSKAVSIIYIKLPFIQAAWCCGKSRRDRISGSHPCPVFRSFCADSHTYSGCGFTTRCDTVWKIYVVNISFDVEGNHLCTLTVSPAPILPLPQFSFLGPFSRGLQVKMCAILNFGQHPAPRHT
jgi:hypothetical protein